MNKYFFLFIFSNCIYVSGQNTTWKIRTAYNLGVIGKCGSLGIEKGFKSGNSLEIHMRFHQNRQYLLWDERNYWNRVHAFTNGQFFGIGAIYSKAFKIKGLLATPMVSFGSQYIHAGIKAQIFEPYATVYDTAYQRTIVYKESIIKTFKPMHILEQTMQFRLRFKVAGIFSMDYSAGIAAAYEWGIDPALPSGKNQIKWLWGPTASIGLVFALSADKMQKE